MKKRTVNGLVNYQRAAGNELDSFLLRNNLAKYQPELFTEVRDQHGNIIDPKKIKRANELTGAGIEYATSLVEYVCTHFKDMIKKTDSSLYYETQPIEWAFALDIMTGRIKGQRGRAERAILNLHASPKPVLIKRTDGHLMSMQPFVIAFDWGRPETLDARTAAKLARYQKGAEELAKKRAKDGEEIAIPEILPIETITLQFSKPLFEDLLRKGGNTYSFPTGMYAKMFYYANYHIKTAETLKSLDHGMEYRNRFDGVTHETNISAFARFARWVMRHNNLTTAQMKDKTHHSEINKPLIDMVREVYPSAISINGRGERRVEMGKIKHFLDMVLFIYFCIDDFLFYPIIKRLTPDTITLELYTDAQRAEKVLGLDTEAGAIIRKAIAPRLMSPNT